MASRTSKTTFAKLDRERRLQEKRQAKQERREARRAQAAAGPPIDLDDTIEPDEPQRAAVDDSTEE